MDGDYGLGEKKGRERCWNGDEHACRLGGWQLSLVHFGHLSTPARGNHQILFNAG